MTLHPSHARLDSLLVMHSPIPHHLLPRILRITLIHHGLDQGSRIEISSPNIPIDHRKEDNQAQERDSVVHRQCRHGSHRRQDEDD